jgi:hypothetical protein
MKVRLDDYIDGDVAYFLGLIIGRGTILESPTVRQLSIEFPYSSLEVEGISSSFDQETAIRLGLGEIRERLLDLLDTDISIVRKTGGVDFVIRFLRNSMIWRNILLMNDGATSYPSFKVPSIFFEPGLPIDWKREFVRGYADVAGNVREANRFKDGRHRVRLDVLNYPTNWQVPVQLCTLLQEHLNVPVQLITWGHPNLGRKFREHQINIFANPFLEIGFSFEHKQKILEEFAAWDIKNLKATHYTPCPGKRHIRKFKESDFDENNVEKLDPALVGNHYDAYWQICKAIGCTRMPAPGIQLELDFIDDTDLDSKDDE